MVKNRWSKKTQNRSWEIRRQNDRPLFMSITLHLSPEDQSNRWIESIDMFIFINLETRKDRREEITRELQRLGVPTNKIHHLTAVARDRGFCRVHPVAPECCDDGQKVRF